MKVAVACLPFNQLRKNTRLVSGHRLSDAASLALSMALQGAEITKSTLSQPVKAAGQF
jgi:hypothetical protein